MSPIVSVIIPAYNVEAYIEKAINSALQQSETNLEVIVVDDASEDRTVEVVQNIQDPRLHVFINSENHGAGATRNRAIRAAKGTWIALLDADDWYALDRIEKLLAVKDTVPDADMIADDLYHIHEQASHPWSTLLLESDECIDSIQKISPIYFIEKDIPVSGGFYLGLTKPLIRRDFLLKHGIEYSAKIKLGQDFWFYLSCLTHQANFFFIPEPYYFYRSRGGSLVTKNKSDRLYQFCQAAREFLQKEVVNDNAELAQAVSTRLVFVEKRLMPYYCVVDRLKQHQWWLALIAMAQNPYFFVHSCYQSLKVLSRRFRFMSQTIIARN